MSPHSLKANHKFINFKCADCGKTYSRRLSQGRLCPVNKRHQITRYWGSIKQNVKFTNPDMAVFDRPIRAIVKSARTKNAIKKQFALDKYLRTQGFTDLESDDVYTEDYDYAAPANFNPKMRYTARNGTRRGCRNYDSNSVTSTKSSGEVRVGNVVGRPSSPGSVMGARVGARARSAQKWAGRGLAYRLNRTKSLEWCHLQADSLGGPTTVDNLVAASFGANTEMLVIEHFLKGKTHFAVEVTAYCSALHVAEFIEYQIYKAPLSGNSTLKFTRLIDARNDYFTEDDADDLQKLLKGALK